MAGVKRIVIPYSPREQFKRFHNREERFAVIVAHRRAGKTVASINDQLRRAIKLTLPHGRYAYVAPFLSQAKQVAWEYLKRFSTQLVSGKPNEGELWLELLNGARIRIHGADNPDRLRGDYLDGVICDEYADWRPSVWGEVIRPMLADRRGWATFIGTPKGRNEFFQLWERAQTDPSWLGVMLRASETGILSADELEQARADMTPEQYAQEFECSFNAAIIGAYYGKEIADLEAAGRIGDVPVDPHLPVHTAWDLGMGDSTAIWFFQVAVGELRIVDFYESAGQPLSHYVQEVNARGYRQGTDWLPHDARVRSLETGRTRVETLTALGRQVRIVSDQKLMDGINAARIVLPLCWFDKARCKDGIEALRHYHADYDERAKTFKDTPRHDWSSHAADAARYMALAYREMKQTEPEKPKTGFTLGSVRDELIREAQRNRYRR